jgi:predicted DNA binding CopG/RHH family protein
MPSKRYNIWFELTLIERIKTAAKKAGIKISTYVRMAVLEKLGREEA